MPKRRRRVVDSIAFIVYAITTCTTNTGAVVVRPAIPAGFSIDSRRRRDASRIYRSSGSVRGDGSSQLRIIYMLRVARIISRTRGRVGGQLVGPFNPLSL